MKRTKQRREPWINQEVWEVLDAMLYINNGCPVGVAIKTLRDGKLKHRTPRAIRAKMDRLEAMFKRARQRIERGTRRPRS